MKNLVTPGGYAEAPEARCLNGRTDRPWNETRVVARTHLFTLEQPEACGRSILALLDTV
jgi:hypothetical protein